MSVTRRMGFFADVTRGKHYKTTNKQRGWLLGWWVFVVDVTWGGGGVTAEKGGRLLGGWVFAVDVTRG